MTGSLPSVARGVDLSRGSSADPAPASAPFSYAPDVGTVPHVRGSVAENSALEPAT